MDPLSDILSLLKPASTISAGLEAGGNWAIRFGPPDGIKFNALIQGACWLAVEGQGEPLFLAEGDCFLLTQPLGFTLASDLTLPTIEAGPIYRDARHGIARCNDGGDFFLIGGRFGFAGEQSSLLFEALPPVVHVRAALEGASVLRWALDRLASEMKQPRAGGALVSEHLAHIMLVEVLRLHLESGGAASGWLQGLADRRLGPVIGAVHADPAHGWTLEKLAELAAMSRSSFAERFRRVVGMAPLAYVARWRMLVAGERLRSTGESIASIAYGLGYQSEAAFSTAFKRTMAITPRDYRRQERD